MHEWFVSFVAKKYYTRWIYHRLIIHSPFQGHSWTSFCLNINFYFSWIHESKALGHGAHSWLPLFKIAQLPSPIQTREYTDRKNKHSPVIVSNLALAASLTLWGQDCPPSPRDTREVEEPSKNEISFPCHKHLTSLPGEISSTHSNTTTRQQWNHQGTR